MKHLTKATKDGGLASGSQFQREAHLGEVIKQWSHCVQKQAEASTPIFVFSLTPSPGWHPIPVVHFPTVRTLWRYLHRNTRCAPHVLLNSVNLTVPVGQHKLFLSPWYPNTALWTIVFYSWPSCVMPSRTTECIWPPLHLHFVPVLFGEYAPQVCTQKSESNWESVFSFYHAGLSCRKPYSH